MSGKASSEPEPPRIMAIEGPDQVVQGTEIELRWKLGGGAPAKLKVDGREVTGNSYKVKPVADPTVYRLTVTNQAGTATAEKWIGTHAEGTCVSGFAEVLLPDESQQSATFHLVLRDDLGRPRRAVKYRLQIGGKTLEGTTAANGAIEHEVPPDVQSGDLTLIFDEADDAANLTYKVSLGAAPVGDGVRAVQEKLNCLGYGAGAPTGEMNEATREAIRSFKREQLDFENPTGDLDHETHALILGN